MTCDVPSPIDLRKAADAKDWEQSAMLKRPRRTEFFSRFRDEIAASPMPVRRVLELGSGPGFLAALLLNSLAEIQLTLLDFSSAMHQLAHERLGDLAKRAEFVERDFKQPDWSDGLGKFDCVVTHQAVHELRHKRHTAKLHKQVNVVLSDGGFYLVCDHFAGEEGMKDDQLFMSVEDQKIALLDAGFQRVEKLMLKGGLVLHRAA